MRARRASGIRESELVQRAKELRETVDPLLPRLTKDCPPERFDRLKKDLEAAREAKDDEKRLERTGRWGDPLVRAYADLLRFYLDPKPPGVLVVPYPGGDVAFAPLGRATKEAQIAVQQYDDPARLMIGYIDWARKGFHFFATRETLYCTGRTSRPPEVFISEHLAGLPYKVQPSGTRGEYLCQHLARSEPIPRLTVEWPDGGVTVSVCRRCTKGDRQLLASLSGGMAIPHPERAHSVDVALNVDCRGGEGCVHRNLPGPSRRILKRYTFGRYGDADLLDAYRSEVLPRVERVSEPLFVAAGVCYGSDADAFLEALHPSPEERMALTAVLPEVRGYFALDQATGSQALEKLWPDHADAIVEAIVPDPERARRLVQEARRAPGRVSDLLHRAARETRERAVLEALPQFGRLTREAAFVDTIARAYRGQGARAAERLIVQTLPGEGKERGLAFGILKALHQDQPHLWQFTPTEQQFGESLAPLAEETLTAPSADYATALGRLLQRAGVAEWRGRE
ncbi:MAG: hypothetical protein WCA77_01975 [Thermoplasmata archaeon]